MKSLSFLSFLFVITPYIILAQCEFGNCQLGYGSELLPNNEKYIGHFENSKFNGQGVYFYQNGASYAGTWKDGKYHGEGRLQDEKGEIVMGVWENGNFKTALKYESQCIYGDCQNGYGIYLYANGVKLTGTFKDGQVHQRVVVFYPNGAKYIGGWKGSMMDGDGILYHADGAVESGIWENGKFTTQFEAALGCVEGDCDNGRGTYVYRNQTIYVGDFKASVANGYGICYFADGDQYVGEWKNHNFDGQGVMYKNEGITKKGLWKNSKYISPTATKSEEKEQLQWKKIKLYSAPTTVIQPKAHISLNEAVTRVNTNISSPLVNNPSMDIGLIKRATILKASNKDKIYVVQEGSGEVLIDAKIIRHKKGDLISIKAGQIYQFKNLSADFKAWEIRAK